MLKNIMSENREGIIKDTIFHIERLVPEYKELPGGELKTTISGAFDAVNLLITKNDYKGITLFLDGIIEKRNKMGIGLPQIRKTLMIFRDVLVSRILFNENYSQELTNSILENVDKLTADCEERLASIYNRHSEKNQTLDIYKATVDYLATPVILFRNDDFKVIYSNYAMDKFIGPSTGQEIFRILKESDFEIDCDKIEEEILTIGSCNPRIFDHRGSKTQILINQLEVDDKERNYSVLTLVSEVAA